VSRITGSIPVQAGDRPYPENALIAIMRKLILLANTNESIILNSFDRLFISAGKIRPTPWSIDHKWEVTLLQRA